MESCNIVPAEQSYWTAQPTLYVQMSVIIKVASPQLNTVVVSDP